MLGLTPLFSAQVGIITFALGLFRLGFLDVVLSRALLKGFITAVGVVIFVEQVRRLRPQPVSAAPVDPTSFPLRQMIGMLGLHPVLKALPHVPATTVAKFRFVVSHLGDAHKLTMLVSILSSPLSMSTSPRADLSRAQIRSPSAHWPSL